jgi:hypothetical protein
VNRDSGTDSANGGWLRRLVRHQNIHNSQKPMTRKSAGFILLAARILARAFFSTLAKRPRLPSLKITINTKISVTYSNQNLISKPRSNLRRSLDA